MRILLKSAFNVVRLEERDNFVRWFSMGGSNDGSNDVRRRKEEGNFRHPAEAPFVGVTCDSSAFSLVRSLSMGGSMMDT